MEHRESIPASFRERWGWAKHNSSWKPWKAQLWEQLALALLGLGFYWKVLGNLSGARDWLTASGIAICFYLVLVPIGSFFGNLARARVGLLEDQILDLQQRNTLLQRMVEANLHKHAETGALLRELVEQAEALQKEEVQTFQEASALSREYLAWEQQRDGPLKALISFAEWYQLTADLEPTGPQYLSPDLQPVRPIDEQGYDYDHKVIRHKIRKQIPRLISLLQLQYSRPNSYFSPSDLRSAGLVSPEPAS